MKRDILFVIVEISEEMENINTTKAERIISDAWGQLQCPLVLISQNKTAFAT
jgi:hypothetical protein